MRLRSVAQGNWQQNRQADETSQCCLIKISLFYSDNELIGWLRPEVLPLEPRGIDPTGICQRVNGWQRVMEDLETQREGGVLVVQRGEPVGWLN